MRFSGGEQQWRYYSIGQPSSRAISLSLSLSFYLLADQLRRLHSASYENQYSLSWTLQTTAASHACPTCFSHDRRCYCRYYIRYYGVCSIVAVVAATPPLVCKRAIYNLVHSCDSRYPNTHHTHTAASLNGSVQAAAITEQISIRPAVWVVTKATGHSDLVWRLQDEKGEWASRNFPLRALLKLKKKRRGKLTGKKRASHPANIWSITWDVVLDSRIKKDAGFWA